MAGRDKRSTGTICPSPRRIPHVLRTVLASWQYPHVNVFKHCQISQWRRCSKEGDVSSQMVTYCSLVCVIQPMFSFDMVRTFNASQQLEATRRLFT